MGGLFWGLPINPGLNHIRTITTILPDTNTGWLQDIRHESDSNKLHAYFTPPHYFNIILITYHPLLIYYPQSHITLYLYITLNHISPSTYILTSITYHPLLIYITLNHYYPLLIYYPQSLSPSTYILPSITYHPLLI